MEAILFKTPYEFLNLWKSGRITAQTENKKVIYFFREETTSQKPVASSPEYAWGIDKIMPNSSNFVTID